MMRNSAIHTYTIQEWLVISAIFMFPVTFLTVRHAVHVSLFLLLVVAIYHFGRLKFRHIQLSYPRDILIFFVFAGLFFATAISQIFRGNIHFAAFDGPSRILIAGIVFLFLKQLNIPYIKILRVAIPFGLISVFLTLMLNPGTYWGERYATYFVDPNSLGAQSLISGLLCFLMLGSDNKRSIPLIVLQVVGGILGLYISIGAGSRGAWLTAPFILLTVFFLRIEAVALSDASQKKKIWTQTVLKIFILFFAAIAVFLISDKLSSRLIGGYHEIVGWFSGVNLDTAAGTRLSIWKFSFEFAQKSLLFGYGEEKNLMQVLQGSLLNVPANAIAINTLASVGPHSDILSKLLSSGIFGLTAYLILLLTPFIIFWRHRNDVDVNQKQAARIGLYYIVGVFVAGLSNEQLSLKYLCTFYGLMIATLLAQVLNNWSLDKGAQKNLNSR
jgi:O-antigen ligase